MVGGEEIPYWLSEKKVNVHLCYSIFGCDRGHSVVDMVTEVLAMGVFRS